MSMMAIFPLVLTWLIIPVTSVKPHRCYECQDMKYDSDNPEISNAFRQVPRKCNPTKEYLVVCPSPQPGNVTKCYTSTTKMAATYLGYEVSAVVTERRCRETPADAADGCRDGQGLTTPPSFTASGVKINSFTATECFCSGDGCNNNHIVQPPTTAAPRGNTVSRSTGKAVIPLRCYQCRDMKYDSDNPAINNVFRQVTRKCNPTEEYLVVCPSPRPGNVTKCYTSTTKMAATYLGYEVSAVFTERRCRETPADAADGCRDGQGLTTPPSLTATGVKINSFTATECFCSGDGCNKNDIVQSRTTAIPRGNTVSRSTGKAVKPLQCYVCKDSKYDSDDPTISSVYNQMTRKCNPTEKNLVSCASPQPGNVTKCYISTTKIEATYNSESRVSAVITERRCRETPADAADGCQGLTTPPSLTALDVNSFAATECFCSGDGCNNDIVQPPTTDIPRGRLTGEPVIPLRCYVCRDMKYDSDNQAITNVFRQVPRRCNPTEEYLVVCPSPQPGNVTKCGTRTAKMAATYLGYEVSAVITERRCRETPAVAADGCRDGQGLTTPPSLTAAGVKINSFTVTECFCSGDGCNKNGNVQPPTTAAPRADTVSRPAGKPVKPLQCYVCKGSKYDSDNPTLSRVYNQMTRKCDPTEKNLVTCASPQPGNVTKCYTSTTKMEATYPVQPPSKTRVSAVVTERRCWETPADAVDGCRDGQGLTTPPSALGVKINSFTVTECFCSGDGCNNNDIVQPPTTAGEQGNGNDVFRRLTIDDVFPLNNRL